jgi:hypothetical protein
LDGELLTFVPRAWTANIPQEHARGRAGGRDNVDWWERSHGACVCVWGCGCVIKRIKSVWLWDWSECLSAIEAIHRQRPAEESKSASFGLGGCIGRGPWTALIGQALALTLAELSASAYPDSAMSLWTARRSTRSVCLISSIPMWQCPAVWQSGGLGWVALVSVVMFPLG